MTGLILGLKGNGPLIGGRVTGEGCIPAEPSRADYHAAWVTGANPGVRGKAPRKAPVGRAYAFTYTVTNNAARHE